MTLKVLGCGAVEEDDEETGGGILETGGGGVDELEMGVVDVGGATLTAWDDITTGGRVVDEAGSC